MAPPKRKSQDDDSDRLYKLLGKLIGGMDKKVDGIEKGLGDTNHRVDTLEAEVFKKPINPARLPAPWKDPKNFKIILWIILVALVLALAFKGIDITKSRIFQ